MSTIKLRTPTITLMAAALVLGAVATPTFAQFPAPAHAVVVVADPGGVQDFKVEASQTQIEASSAATARSTTIGDGAGDYTPNAGTISNLDNMLFAGVNSGNFTGTFPGFVPRGTNSTETMKNIIGTTLATYKGAISTAQQQAREIQGESFSNIEAKSAQGTLLTAVQANTEAVLQVAEQLQYERQLLVTLITVESTKAAQELNDKAQAEAQKQNDLLNMYTGQF